MNRRAAIIEALAYALRAQKWPDERLVREPEIFPIRDEGHIDLGMLADAVLAARRRSPPSEIAASPQAAGGRARADSMTPEARSAQARRAATARWGSK